MFLRLERQAARGLKQYSNDKEKPHSPAYLLYTTVGGGLARGKAITPSLATLEYSSAVQPVPCTRETKRLYHSSSTTVVTTMPLASAPRRQAAEATDAEFTVSTSLPPMVTGVVAGEIELSVPYLYPKPGVLCATRYLGNRRCEPMFAVRMQWWGDREPGTVLKPDLLTGKDEHGVKARQARLSKATCALFPVRCGLDGLVVYLRDMVR